MTSKSTGCPFASTTKYIFVVALPREQPIALASPLLAPLDVDRADIASIDEYPFYIQSASSLKKTYPIDFFYSPAIETIVCSGLIQQDTFLREY